MKILKICFFTIIMMAAFLIPATAFASITPQGSYQMGDIIGSPDIASGTTAYYQINSVSIGRGDLMLSVSNSKSFDIALGYMNEIGEFTPLPESRVVRGPDGQKYIRYANLTSISGDVCYLKATNNDASTQRFTASVTYVSDQGEYSLGKLINRKFEKDASVVYRYHPKADKEKNCVLMLYGEDFEQCCLDYFLVDAGGNAINVDYAELYSQAIQPYNLKDAGYELYIQPSLTESADGDFPHAPTTSVPYKLGIIPLDMKYFTVSNPKSYTYNGNPKKPSVTVKYGSINLVRYEDFYTVYHNNINAGTAKVVVDSDYLKGSVTKTFTIKKAANTMKASAPASKSFKAKTVKKKAQKFRAITVTKAKGTISYKVKYANAKSKKALSFNKKTRMLTVKKKTKKGTYKITISAIGAGNKNFLKKTLKKTITIKVK